MADRLAWTDGQLHVGEMSITTRNEVSIFDGTEKVSRNLFENQSIHSLMNISRQIINEE